MTDDATGSDAMQVLARRVRSMQADCADIGESIATLRNEYRKAGGDLRRRSEADLSAIAELRQEAEQLVQLIRGGSLFGRYAADAQAQKRQANRWRLAAMVVLGLAVCLELFIALGNFELGWTELTAISAPWVLLFTYTSAESRTHRRTEFNRRRIYLRMNAIEVYTKGGEKKTTEVSGKTGEKKTTEGQTASDDLQRILHTFIERHFIEPQLDPSHLDPAPTFLSWLFSRRSRPPQNETHAPGSS